MFSQPLSCSYFLNIFFLQLPFLHIKNKGLLKIKLGLLKMFVVALFITTGNLQGD